MCVKNLYIINIKTGENIQVVYQIPPIINGILFVAHGCSHAGTFMYNTYVSMQVS
jgi:hypothetical protein